MADIDLSKKFELKISVTATKTLQNALDSVQRFSKVRTITAQDIKDALDRIPVPKCHLNGTVVYWDGAESFPQSYKYTPTSTHWTAENISGKWYITDIRRSICPNRSTFRGTIVYSDEAKQWIICKASVLA